MRKKLFLTLWTLNIYLNKKKKKKKKTFALLSSFDNIQKCAMNIASN